MRCREPYSCLPPADPTLIHTVEVLHRSRPLAAQFVRHDSLSQGPPLPEAKAAAHAVLLSGKSAHSTPAALRGGTFDTMRAWQIRRRRRARRSVTFRSRRLHATDMWMQPRSRATMTATAFMSDSNQPSVLLGAYLPAYTHTHACPRGRKERSVHASVHGRWTERLPSTLPSTLSSLVPCACSPMDGWTQIFLTNAGARSLPSVHTPSRHPPV